ncbi:MAG TPA: hypothetical protein VFT84_05765, partial [Gemmatimonadales bacterium]|nr:hypothetical protein [Gemmatimonadales bacterium]
NQLIISGVATDPRNALLSDLARRLHRHRVASLRMERGVTLGQVDELLGALSADPAADPGPLGLRPERSASWRHLQVQAPELNRLLLEDDPDAETRTAGGELWLGLANLALAGDGEAPTEGDDPLVVARAIDAQAGQVEYDRVVLDYLGQMAEEMSGRAGAWEPRMRERVSRLVASLHPKTLRRLLEAGADHAERQRFALTAAEVLAVDAVVEVLEAAAATTGQTISSHLLRLLHKFAHHAEHGDGPARAEAESVLRQNVAQLVANWALEDPNPAEYTAVLDGLVHKAPVRSAPDPQGADCEPELVLQIALETGATGPRVLDAVDRLIAARQVPRVTALLLDAPSAVVAEPLWHHVASPARLRAELEATPVDFAAVEALALRLGPSAVEPLIDLLEATHHRSTRARALRLLISMGPVAVVPAAARLPKAPWYVQRNLLTLLRTLKGWPQGFSAVPYALHQDHRVRREAFKLLLEYPLHRTSAITHGLADANDGIVHMILRAALGNCPREAQPALQRFIGNRGRSPELRALAVRVLGETAGPQGIPALLGLAGARRSLLGWRLGDKSPVSLAALNALARYWAWHPQTIGLLALARQHPDPDIRLAARARLA